MKMKLKEIKPNPDNPRVIKDWEYEKLKQSVQDFPEMLKLRPLVIDETNTILGGNMRYRVLQDLGIKEVEVMKAKDLTEEQKKEFIIKDNLAYGEWDWAKLDNEWDTDDLNDWGLETGGFDINPDEYGDGFSLPDGDKAPFQQMTFTLADEQAEQIKTSISDVKQTDVYKNCETMGNENSNGNALYTIVKQWAEQKK